MKNCIICNGHIDKVGMLHRTAPLGQAPANWTCWQCILKTEPELAKNIRDDMESTPFNVNGEIRKHPLKKEDCFNISDNQE